MAQSKYSPIRPSEAQARCLASLPAQRPVLLQYHLIWQAGSDHTALRRQLRQAIGQSGVQLHSVARVDMLAIGRSEQSWQEIWLAEFSGPETVERHCRDSALEQVLKECAQVEVLLATAPPAGMRRTISWLNRLLPWMPAPRSDDVIPEAELRGVINPTPEQFAALQSVGQTQPVHMFNLLRFHDRARYADGDRGRSGQQAYEKGYGRVAMQCFLRLGGRIVMLGRYRFRLIGGQGDPAPQDWHEIAVIQYPSRAAFTRMLGMPRYQRALEHRHAGLAHTRLWSTTPEAEYRS